MTEKHYGGASSFGVKNSQSNKTLANSKNIPEQKTAKLSANSNSENKASSDEDKIVKAGKISSEVKKYIRQLIKPGIKLIEIAEKIESKIAELGGKPAFPTNLSINEIAAHSTPSFNDETTASGLLKVDLGVHIEGYVADTAFSLDLENSEENKKLISSAESALKKATDLIKLDLTLSEIGSVIEKEIKANGFQPIQNLSGHSIEQYDLHSGITIPNLDNSSDYKLESGLYAIEPFVTLPSGLGSVRDGKPSGIYHLEKTGNVRDNFAREVLNFIAEEYQTLPFCSRWIYKKFGSRGLLALRQIEQAGCLHHYKQLIEKSGTKVAQAEQTILLTKDKKIITTE